LASGPKTWKFNGGYHGYPHPGSARAWTRTMLDRSGGLFEEGGIGSGDSLTGQRIETVHHKER
jgi:hypothetical protein